MKRSIFWAFLLAGYSHAVLAQVPEQLEDVVSSPDIISVIADQDSGVLVLEGTNLGEHAVTSECVVALGGVQVRVYSCKAERVVIAMPQLVDGDFILHFERVADGARPSWSEGPNSFRQLLTVATLIQGDAGDQGPVGSTGPQGDTGDSGGTVDGVRVFDNGDVEISLTWSDTPVALGNATGPQGLQGVVGSLGEVGPVGEMGLKGVIGLVGPQGIVGLQGPAGAQGEQGPRGTQGAVGDVGPQGPVGAVGARGPEGEIGPRGPDGDAGPVGFAGPQGAVGVDGVIGDPGEKGPDGNDGASGVLIENAHADHGRLIVSLDDGTEIDAGANTGPAGPGSPFKPARLYAGDIWLGSVAPYAREHLRGLYNSEDQTYEYVSTRSIRSDNGYLLLNVPMQIPANPILEAGYGSATNTRESSVYTVYFSGSDCTGTAYNVRTGSSTNSSYRASLSSSDRVTHYDGAPLVRFGATPDGVKQFLATSYNDFVGDNAIRSRWNRTSDGGSCQAGNYGSYSATTTYSCNCTGSGWGRSCQTCTRTTYYRSSAVELEQVSDAQTDFPPHENVVGRPLRIVEDELAD